MEKRIQGFMGGYKAYVTASGLLIKFFVQHFFLHIRNIKPRSIDRGSMNCIEDLFLYYKNKKTVLQVIHILS